MPGKVVAFAAAVGMLALGACSSPIYKSTLNTYNLTIARLQLAQSSELPSNQLDRVNGTYKGVITLVEAHNPNCPPTQWGIIDVGDDTLMLPYTPAVIMSVAVQPDGRLHGQAGTTVLDGVLRDGWLNFTVSSPACTSRYNFRYV